MKKIRFNANIPNSSELRKIQKEFEAAYAPARFSLERLANMAIECGLDLILEKINQNEKQNHGNTKNRGS